MSKFLRQCLCNFHFDIWNIVDILNVNHLIVKCLGSDERLSHILVKSDDNKPWFYIHQYFSGFHSRTKIYSSMQFEVVIMVSKPFFIYSLTTVSKFTLFLCAKSLQVIMKWAIHLITLFFHFYFTLVAQNYENVHE